MDFISEITSLKMQLDSFRDGAKMHRSSAIGQRIDITDRWMTQIAAEITVLTQFLALTRSS